MNLCHWEEPSICSRFLQPQVRGLVPRRARAVQKEDRRENSQASSNFLQQSVSTGRQRRRPISITILPSRSNRVNCTICTCSLGSWRCPTDYKPHNLQARCNGNIARSRFLRTAHVPCVHQKTTRTVQYYSSYSSYSYNMQIPTCLDLQNVRWHTAWHVVTHAPKLCDVCILSCGCE